MSEKIFKVNGGEEIVIRVPRREVPEAGRPKLPTKRKGIIPVRATSDFLPRRLKKSGIQFYDGSYVKNDSGQFSNLNIINNSIVPNYATYTDLVSQILNIGIEKTKKISEIITDFETEYKADGFLPFFITVIAGGTTYRISDSLRSESHPNYNTKWKPSGLSLSDSELNAADFYINGIKLAGEDKNKITSILNPFAPAVEFTPTKKMDVLFVPDIIVYEGEASYYNYNLSDDLFVLASSKIASTTLPDIRYNKQSPYYRQSVTAYFGANTSQGASDDYFAAYRAVLAAQYYGLSTAGLISNALAFPVPPNPPSVTGGYATWELGVGSINTGNTVSRVLLVIRQNGNLFYVWN